MDLKRMSNDFLREIMKGDMKLIIVSTEGLDMGTRRPEESCRRKQSTSSINTKPSAKW